MPEPRQEPATADGPALEEVVVAVGLAAQLGLELILRSQEAGDAVDEAAQGVLVDGLAAAEVVEDLALGATRDRVAVVVGELGVLGDGAVLVLAPADADIHDHRIAAYYQSVKPEVSTA